MAQWIARLTSNQKVAGSSPAVGVFFCKNNKKIFFLLFN